MRGMPRSIQGRMLVLSALATLVALALAGVFIASVLERLVTQGIDRRLDASLALMASAVANDGTVDRTRLIRLRAALDAGPGWQWRIEAPDGSFGSDDLPIDARTLRAGHGRDRDDHIRPFEGRDASRRPVHARQLSIDTPAGTALAVAAAPRDVIERPVRGALLSLLTMLALLGGVLGAAAVLQIRLGLRPVRRLRDAVVAIRSGAARSIHGDQPAELAPLADELNALVRDNDAALATARASAANLAHALKTPVATLALELRGDPRSEEVDRIDKTIRHHLARARVAAGSVRSVTALDDAIEALISTMERLHADRAIKIEVEVTPALKAAIDPADFDELFGNLLDNAVRHARSHVIVRAYGKGAMLHLQVSDDGAGISAANRARATAPGVRLDEQGDGHGFGLAIARELSALYGGALNLEESTAGGLLAQVALPQAPTSV